MASGNASRTKYVKAVIIVKDVYLKILAEYIDNPQNPMPPQTLHAMVKRDNYFISKLSRDEMHIMPTLLTEGYKEFDFTFLYKLTRYFNLVSPPTRGWGNQPCKNELTIGDDIERLRKSRNAIIHTPRAELSMQEEHEFNHLSLEVGKRADYFLRKHPDHGFQKEISDIQINLIDSDMEKKYIQSLEEIEQLKLQHSETVAGNVVNLYYGNDIKMTFGSEADSKLGILHVYGLKQNSSNDDVVRILNEMKENINNGNYGIVFNSAETGSVLLNVVFRLEVWNSPADLHRHVYDFMNFIFSHQQLSMIFKETVDVIMYSDDYIDPPDKETRFIDDCLFNLASKKNTSIKLNVNITKEAVENPETFHSVATDFIDRVQRQSGEVLENSIDLVIRLADHGARSAEKETSFIDGCMVDVYSKGHTRNVDVHKGALEHPDTFHSDATGLIERVRKQSDDVIGNTTDLAIRTSNRRADVFIKPLRDITCYEGDTVSLDCTVAGGKKPKKWYKEGEAVLSDRIIDQSKDQTYKLTFLRVTRADAGVYQVLIGDETRDVRLNVIERQPSLVTLRQYQIEMAGLALRGVNTIICAGTNAGKTYVAFHVIENHLLLHPKDGKVVFINKTNVLLGQQYKRACDTFVELHMQGKIKLWKADEDDAKEFAKEIGKSSMIFLTPMSLCNHLSDTAEVKVAVGDFTLLVFDECHHVQGNNPYNEIMGHYRRAKYDDKSTKLPQILGLTASPGSNKAKDLQSAKDHIRKIMTNLDVGQLSVVKIHKDELLEHCSMPAKESIRSTTRGDDPVKEIVFDAMKYVEDKLNCRRVSKFLMEHVNASSDLYNALGNPPLQRTEVRYIQWICGTKSKIESVLHLDPQVPRLLLACFRHLELYTECLEVNSLLDIDQVRDVIREGYAAESYSSQKANTDEEKDIIDKMKDVFAEIREIGRNIETNPDIKAVLNKIDSEYQKFQEEARFLIFVKTRATAVALADRLPDYLRATYLTGSHKSVEEGGRPADEQVEILEKFRRGEHLCIVATSVGSEGLDVPQCNVMIRYRFSTDEISSLQMRGRIRSQEGSEVIVGTSKEFEIESKNIQRQYLMSKAVNELSRRDLTRDLTVAEKKVYEVEESERKAAKIKDGRKQKGFFSIYCRSCSEVIADGGCMRHVNNKMYLVCEKQILKKVQETPLPQKKQKRFDGCLKQGKAKGLVCGHNWGSIMIYQENKFVALSQDSIKIFDKENNTFLDCEKWCDLKFRIEPITREDIINYSS